MDSMGNDHLPDLTSPAAARIIYPSAPSKAKHRATTSVALSNSVRGEPSNFLKAMGGHWYQFATWNLYHWDAILWKFHVRLIDNDYVLLIYHEFHGLELWNYKWRYWILLILHQGQRHSLVRSLLRVICTAQATCLGSVCLRLAYFILDAMQASFSTFWWLGRCLLTTQSTRRSRKGKMDNFLPRFPESPKKSKWWYTCMHIPNASDPSDTRVKTDMTLEHPPISTGNTSSNGGFSSQSC